MISSSDQNSAQIAPTLLQAITPRERDILRLLANGLCNREIAQQLGLSEKTIKIG